MTWTRFVDSAFSRLAIKKNAISVGKFLQALANTDSSEIKLLELPHVVEALFFSQCRDFFLVHPHIPRCSSTAVTTLSALESKAVAVPRFFGHLAIPFGHELDEIGQFYAPAVGGDERASWATAEIA